MKDMRLQPILGIPMGELLVTYAWTMRYLEFLWEFFICIPIQVCKLRKSACQKESNQVQRISVYSDVLIK
uniref:Uncharacterized protein n=1 Tax=Arundo donax TaxID=35708 RepID=A0A0A9F548_ARUDO